MKRTCLQNNTTCPDLSGNTHAQSRVHRDHPVEISVKEQCFYPKEEQQDIGFVRMKVIYLIIILAFAYSCKGDLEKANEDIKGTWKLESVQYEDATGAVKVVSDKDITLIFTNDQSSISTDDSGIQIIGSDTTYFEYNVSDYSFCFYFDETKYVRNSLTEFISMCYDFNKIDKKTIEFYSNSDVDFVNNEKWFNTSYLYTKIGRY